ncbi:ly6/PLAUR domain-containing protein 6-like [Gouania willdenowi]|uniref:Ly6/PLAUR domain-containing protein 6-like n=1 Tax=Gouania willdenowi TaxID=441366 RepID=A0A8C5I7K5_GOUWI|nr:ly6/PLAUR domain-containing protein 6-like [Gouania willdenowi]XP_028292495.1 ly6/PLAUR domain-containing protein 6-like [Gouania willdenowi]
MELWPVVAYLLLHTIFLHIIQCVQAKDFSEQDIVHLHPSTTPFPGGFKCFTCEDAPDNFECNRWAPDVYCFREARYCFTRHMMSSGGDSVSVTKRCVAVDDCRSTGCVQMDHQGLMVCTSCCEGNICNLSLPWNQTGAVLLTRSSRGGGGGGGALRHTHTFSLIITSYMFSIL